MALLPERNVGKELRAESRRSCSQISLERHVDEGDEELYPFSSTDQMH